MPGRKHERNQESPPKKRSRGRPPKEEKIKKVHVQSELDAGDPLLSKLKVDDRVAYKFADSIYFGSIVRISRPKPTDKNRKQGLEMWRWEVEFDDGDCWELDADDMLRAVSLYEICKEEERNDENRHDNVDKIINAFFAEKYKILNALPNEVKDEFLEVGFAKWNKVYLPVLFLGPFDLSPGFVRNKWMTFFEKAGKDLQKLRKLPRIVYWYGGSEDEAFSIMPRADCMSCEEGTKKGFSHIPLAIHRKLESGAKLTKLENLFLKGLDALMKDLQKSPEERIIPIERCLEDYQLVVRGMRLVMEIEAKNRLNLEGKIL